MNKEQYNNIIEHSIVSKETDNINQLELTRDICNNMGVALPHGDVSEVSQILATDDYMFWRSCSKEEAQEYADNGVAAIAVTETDISLIKSNTGEVSESVDALADGPTTYYAYSAGTTSNTVTQIVKDGTYFLNNAQYGKYLQKENSSIKGISGLLADLGSSIKWKIEFKGSYYVIRYAADPSQYLAAAGMDSAAIQFTKVTSSTIPTSCRWKLSHATHGMGGILIKNVYNSKYLIWRAMIMLTDSIGSPDTVTYAQAAWRKLPVSQSNKELTSFTVNNKTVYLGEPFNPTINASNDAAWVSSSDFSYSFEGNNIKNGVFGTLIGEIEGSVEVTATHKITLKTTQFTVTVNECLKTISCYKGQSINAKSAVGNNSLALNKNIVWETNDIGIATVTSEGIVTGINQGYTFICAKNSDGQIILQCEVRVLTEISEMLSAFSYNEVQYLYCPSTQLSNITRNLEDGFYLKVKMLYAFHPFFALDLNDQDLGEIHSALYEQTQISLTSHQLTTLFNEAFLGYRGLYNPEYLNNLRKEYFNNLKEIFLFCAPSIAQYLDPANYTSNCNGVADLKIDLSQCWTNGKGNNKVMLGSTYGDVRYYDVAERNGTFKYFFSRDYMNFKIKYGKLFVTDINYRFLDTALAQNCEFYTTHLPSAQYANAALYKEFEYLKSVTGCNITTVPTTDSFGETIFKLVFSPIN